MKAAHVQEGIAGYEVTSALKRLLSQQHSNGCWEGEVVWCSIITAQYVIVRAIVGRHFEESERTGLIQQFESTRGASGGWGLNRESAPYVYVTTLGYVALRLLGLSPEHPLTASARKWLRAQPGGVLAIPSWGKFWLAMLGLYRWEGVNPLLPEFFLLPAWFPIHPSHFYCHTRLIYQAMAFLYGIRLQVDLGPLVEELRRELYDRSWDQIDFTAHRHDVASSDVYMKAQPSRTLRFAFDLESLGMRLASKSNRIGRFRRQALDRCFEYILAEQQMSHYQGISPVSSLLNSLTIWAQDRNHRDLAPSLQGLEAWRWHDAESGIRFAGARSNAWDTAFAMQAILELPEGVTSAREELKKAYRFLRETQITEEVTNFRKAFRDPALGGWCFSDGVHRWPVSDCTAEVLTAVLKLHEVEGLVSAEERIPDRRLSQAIDFILLRQNRDGGFSTYERRRGRRWLEALNPSEMFGNCMVDHSYVECTASCLRALANYRATHRGPLDSRIGVAMRGGVKYLRRQQRQDGSWAGSWGVNFTYGTFFAMEGLRAAGAPSDDPALQRAANWLILHQRRDGGWGEHYSSCLTNRYVEHSESQVAMTSWALIALLGTSKADSQAVAHGVAWLKSFERPDGSWPKQSVNGMFFATAMLDYLLYKSYFPLWALGRFARRQGQACLARTVGE